jgi:chromosome segregation ATPase
MEDTLKLILSKLDKLDTIDQEVKELKISVDKIDSRLTNVESKIDKLDKREDEHFDHLAAAIFDCRVKLEDKIDATKEHLEAKLDGVYINTDGIAKHFTDTTQEVAVIQYRQGEHSGQLEDHEERIKKLEAVE